MRFLIYTQYFPPEIGAAQTRLASMAKQLKDAGHEVEVLTALPNYPYEQIFEGYRGKWMVSDEWEGIPVHRYWIYSAQGSGIRRLFNYLSFIVCTFMAFYKLQRPDIIFVNSGPLFLSIPAYFAARRFGVPYIFNVSDLWPRSVEKLKVLKSKLLIRLAEKLEMWSYENAMAITSVTDGIREILINEKNVKPEKILFLPNGLDTDIFDGKLKRSYLSELGLKDKKVFTYPGTHGHAHALDKVLDAAKTLQNEEDIHFLFVGGGSEKPELLKKAEAEKIKNVSFYDPVPQSDLNDILTESYCGLIHQKDTPLANETRPAKMFPILGSGKGVIFGGFGEGARFVESIEAGIVVEPEKPELMAKMVKKMAQETEVVRQWGENGREFVQQNMSWKILVDEWLKQLFPLSRLEEQPLVSIVMPAYNAAQFIRESIDSVIAQTYQNWELIIVDDSSEDSTTDIIKEYSLRDPRIKGISSKERLGVSGARNLAFDAARGDLVAFLDSDDLWLPIKLERQINFMLRMKCSMSYTAFRRITQAGKKVGRILPIPNEVDYNKLLKQNVIGTLTVIIDRKITGPVKMKPVGNEDFVLWLEIVKRHGRVLGYQEDCARYRVVAGSLSANKFRGALRVWTNYRNIQKLSFADSLWYFFNYAIRVSYKHSRF